MSHAIRNETYKAYTGMYSALFGPSAKSKQFEQNGKLTPEEFVAAGDQLTRNCRSWKWVGGKEKTQPHLPADKKYLVMSAAPCEERANAFNEDKGGEGVDMGEEGEEWCITHKDHQKVEESEIPSMDDGPGEAAGAAADEEDIPDMDMDEDIGLAEEDEDPAAPSSQVKTVPCRRYDIHLLYDDFHGTPRVYLSGYSETQTPLSKEEMYDDIFADYAHKTTTEEAHPHTGTRMLSIHPCRHAETMKRMIDRMKAEREGKDSESGVRPDMALFLFLKFINSVIPTIDYDYTFDVSMAG